MLRATVQDNTLSTSPMEPTACKPGPTASLADGWASGSIQRPVKDQSLSACINATG
jgi:hypothetical protein